MKKVSDYYVIVACSRIHVNLSKSYTRDVWDYKRADVNLFNMLIEQYNWDFVFSKLFKYIFFLKDT